MNVEILKSTISDNFFYLVSDDEGRAALIDPVDAATALERLRRGDLKLQWVVNTHFHHDHVAGDDDVLDEFSDARLVAGSDAARIDVEHDVSEVLASGDVLPVGDLELQVFDTPGHTPGHISLYGGDRLFSGDTVFVGGAGNCRFGGDPGVLFGTYRDVLTEFDDDVTFYPGHDYARRNVEFALSLQPDHPASRAMLDRIDSSDDEELFLTTLGEERQYNPFFRWDDVELREALQSGHESTWEAERSHSDDDDEATFRTIRALRNDW